MCCGLRVASLLTPQRPRPITICQLNNCFLLRAGVNVDADLLSPMRRRRVIRTDIPLPELPNQATVPTLQQALDHFHGRSGPRRKFDFSGHCVLPEMRKAQTFRAS